MATKLKKFTLIYANFMPIMDALNLSFLCFPIDFQGYFFLINLTKSIRDKSCRGDAALTSKVPNLVGHP